MIGLCIPPVLKGGNLCDYWALDLGLLQDISDFDGLCLLLAVMVKDCAPTAMIMLEPFSFGVFSLQVKRADKCIHTAFVFQTQIPENSTCLPISHCKYYD